MRCPRCRCSKLKVGIVFAGEVACTFRDNEVVEVLETGALDSYWSDDSACQCIDCGWAGRVADLQRTPPQSEPPLERAADRHQRINEIERRVQEGYCPRAIRRDVRQMLQMIRNLQKQVQILETVKRVGRRSQFVGGNDTAIF